MKKVIYLLFLPLLAALSACQETPQNTLAMCHDPNAIAEFSLFASDQNFRNAHPSPLPIEVAQDGETVEFPVEGGANGQAFLVKSQAPTDHYLLLLHEWWGLNDYVKREADYWSKELNINVLAIDLYDGQVATESEMAAKIMQSNDPARSRAIITGAMKFAGEKADFRTMGWCFGGGWSLQTALLAGDKLLGCVMFYGMPEKDVEKLKTLNSSVVFIHASRDKWISDEVVAEFEKNMAAAGKSLAVHRFDADHAFANPSSPRYNEAAANAAREAVRSYFTAD